MFLCAIRISDELGKGSAVVTHDQDRFANKSIAGHTAKKKARCSGKRIKIVSYSLRKIG